MNNKYKILLVEDDEHIRIMVHALARQHAAICRQRGNQRS